MCWIILNLNYEMKNEWIAIAEPESKQIIIMFLVLTMDVNWAQTEFKTQSKIHLFITTADYHTQRHQKNSINPAAIKNVTPYFHISVDRICVCTPQVHTAPYPAALPMSTSVEEQNSASTWASCVTGLPTAPTAGMRAHTAEVSLLHRRALHCYCSCASSSCL